MKGEPMRQQRFLWALLVVFGGALLVWGGTCGTVSDQIRRVDARVWAGSPAHNLPEILDANWHALSAGDVVKTDSSGQAELTLVNCNGHLWVFKGSHFGVYTCTRLQKESGQVGCLEAGDAGFNLTCSGRFTISTASCTITIQGTAFTVSYLPERLLTLVTVLQGKVDVTPVLDADTGRLAGEAVGVYEGQYLYTTPGEVPPPIAGLPARTALPLDSLPALVKELNLEPRFDDITRWGLEQMVLPPVWPFAPDVGMWGQGAPLDQPLVEGALLRAVDFNQVLASGMTGVERLGLTIFLRNGRSLDAYTLAYDPASAKKQLAEGGYPDGFAVYVAFPEGDRLLAGLAERIALQLAQVGLDAKATPVPAGELDKFLAGAVPQDAVTYWLLRR